MNIVNIFCQSHSVTSHIPYGLLFSNRFGIRLNGLGVFVHKKIVIHLNGLGYLFGKNCHPFEQLGLSVRKKDVILSNGLGYPFENNCHPFKWLVLSVQKRNWQLFEQLKLHSNINFSRVSIPKTFRRLPLTHAEPICYSPGHVRCEVCLQTHHE